MIPQATPRPKIALSTVKAVRLDTPWLMLVYGMPGVGKSTLASKIPNAVFIMAETRGTDELEVARYPERVANMGELYDAIDRLRTEPHDFTSLVIDKIDDVEQWVHAAVLAKDPKKPQTLGLAFGGFNKGPEAAVDEWRRLAGALERLQEDRKMGVVLLSHAVRRKFKDPKGSDYQRWEPNVHELASNFLVGWCKEVLFAEEESAAVEEKGKMRGVSTGVRLLRTRYAAAYHAKNRHELPDPLPLDYTALAEAMKLKQTEAPDVIKARIDKLLGELADEKINAAVQASTDPLNLIENRLLATLAARKGQ